MNPFGLVRYRVAGARAFKARVADVAPALLAEDVETLVAHGRKHAISHHLGSESSLHSLTERLHHERGGGRLPGVGVLKSQVSGAAALGTVDPGVDQFRAQDRDAKLGLRLREFVVEALTQRQHGVLAHVISRRKRERGHGRHRGRVDDVARAILGEHARHEALHSVNDTERVDAEYPLVILDRDFPRRSPDDDARIVAQQVDSPETLVGRIGQSIDGLGPGDVRGYAKRRAAEVFEQARRLVETRFVHVRDHDPHPLACGLQCQRAADATRGAGHDGYLVAELLHDDPSKMEPGAPKRSAAPEEAQYPTANSSMPSAREPAIVDKIYGDETHSDGIF